jgi:hypothetical protein
MKPDQKPIRVFFSALSRRFYATKAYRVDDRGIVTVTGKKYDVTNEIAELIERHDITFERRKTDI